MLTNGFYVELASFVAGTASPAGNLFIAVGAGDPAWDSALPTFNRNTTALEQEIARRAVAPDEIDFLDRDGQVSTRSTSWLRARTTFGRGEGTGTLREVGLYAGDASTVPNSGTLLCHIVHPRLEKTPTMALTRSLQVDLTPRASGPGQVATQFLGNSHTREFHDMENLSGACQIDEIRTDRRIFFAHREQAAGVGYDPCAFCMPGESQR